MTDFLQSLQKSLVGHHWRKSGMWEWTLAGFPSHPPPLSTADVAQYAAFNVTVFSCFIKSQETFGIGTCGSRAS